MDPQLGEESSQSSMASVTAPGSAPSPQSEAVTNELQELSLQPAPNLLPLRERKNVLQLKLQQRRTREELVSQGIMPPLKSPAAFHEQRKSLERARTEDYLKRKIRSRPERSELVRMHILEETSAEPSLQAKQLQLKRARLADDLNDKISHRPGPMELIHKNILPVHCSLKQALIETDFTKGTGESSSFDEDSSDALSPELANHDSPIGPAPLPSPPEAVGRSSDPSPTQFLSQVPPPRPPPPATPSLPQKLTNGAAAPVASRATPSLIKQSKGGSERPSPRSKKPKESKPKVKKLKYHQYIPPDQKAEREPHPPLDSTYAKILHQQQLFLQLQIINQQQQHYNYHTILPAPPKPPVDQQPPSNNGPSPSRTVSTPSATSSNQSGLNRQNHLPLGGAKPGALPTNLDDLKVAELKHELKIRGLPVSGTKSDLIERLRNFQEQNGGAASGVQKNNPPQQLTQPVVGGTTVMHQSGEGGVVLTAFPFVATVGGGGAQTAAPPTVMQFGSTSSSPPASPTPSDRSLAGMSPDEISCNGDAFGEMVSSPLTQLSLHPSPQHPTSVKEESSGLAPSACRFSQHAARQLAHARESRTGSSSSTAATSATRALDKDQMLQEKDKQIEELTRMLHQKQRLVETLRSQLEQGKRGGGDATEVASVRIKEEPPETPGDPSPCCHYPFTSELAEEDAIRVTIKEEEEEEPEEALPNPPQQDGMDRSQPAQFEQPMELPKNPLPQMFEHLQQQQMAELELQLSQQQQQQQQQPAELQLQQILLQQTHQRQPQLLLQQQQQKKKKKSAKQQQKHKQQLQAQQQQSVQLSPEFISQPPNSSVGVPSLSLDLLKTSPTPALFTDGNGSHFLVALTNHSAEVRSSESPRGKVAGHGKLQRLQSTPTMSTSQSPTQLANTDTQSNQQLQPVLIKQPIRKGQKTGLKVSTNRKQGTSKSFSAPPNLQPFFLNNDSSPSEDHTPPAPIHMGEVCSGLDQHALFGPPSPVPEQTSASGRQVGKENGSCQHMDDLFDILIQSGEISASFKADPDLSRLRPNTPPISPSPSPLQFSPFTPPEAPASEPAPGGDPPLPTPGDRDQEATLSGSGRLEDFLESTTGKPLLGAEPGGPLTLIDDLHSQMLSTSSILDHPPSPMDTCDLTFTPHPAGLDLGDPALDSMDWLDITMGGGNNGGSAIPSLSSHAPPSVFSADFLDSSDLQLHWDSCL